MIFNFEYNVKIHKIEYLKKSILRETKWSPKYGEKKKSRELRVGIYTFNSKLDVLV